MAMKKMTGASSPVARGVAKAKPRTSAGKSNPKAAARGKGSLPKSNPKGNRQGNAADVNKAIKALQKRTGVTAREARDIVTEIGTIAKYNYSSSYWGISKEEKKKKATAIPGTVQGVYSNGMPYVVKRNPAAKSGLQSLKKQIKEVGTAAKTGKAGTSAARTVRDKNGDLSLDRSAGAVSRNARSKNSKANSKKPVGPKGR